MKVIDKNKIATAITILIIGFSSCRKVIEVDAPFTSLNAENVYTADATAAAVLTDIYAEMSAQNNAPNNPIGAQDITSISLYASLSADELVLYNTGLANLLGYYRNDLNKTTSQPVYWNAIYPVIFRINSAIEGLSASATLTPSVKQQLLGEAKFIRSFCYFYLVNMYGDVPLVLSTDWKINALIRCTPKDQVYLQIISDLKDAQNLLSSLYLKNDIVTPYPIGSAERIRPNKWAATAMLSRAYLFIGDWVNAEAESTKIINNTTMYGLTTLTNAFKMNNTEAIWQLQPVGNNTNANTGEGKLFILPSGGPNTSSYPVYLSMHLVNSFESGDLRKSNWVDSVKPGSIAYYYAKKYKIGNVNTTSQEYPTILRLAEQYLIRAESRAQQNKLQLAIDDVNYIRLNHGGLSTPLPIPGTLLDAVNIILHEREVELFTEWGHRWFDLKRTNNIDAIMSVVTQAKGGTWSAYKAMFPIPQTDIDKNPNLIQNQGY